RLGAMRAEGTAASRVLIVGRQSEIAQVRERLERDGGHRFQPVGTIAKRVKCPDDAAEIARAAIEHGADAVMLTEHPRSEELLRELTWALEGTSTEIIVSTRFHDVSLARTRLDIVDGASFVRVALPDHDRPNLQKRAFDVVAAAIII